MGSKISNKLNCIAELCSVSGMFTHLIRIDMVTHSVVSGVKKFHRNGVTMCGVRIDKTANVLAPFRLGDDRRHDITCTRCITAHTGLENVLDRDFGFTITHDDGTGRFKG